MKTTTKTTTMQTCLTSESGLTTDILTTTGMNLEHWRNQECIEVREYRKYIEMI